MNSTMNDKPFASIHPGTPLSLINLTYNNPNDEKKNPPLKVEKDDLNRHISECQKKKYNWSEFPELVERINSDDRFKQFFGLIGIRKLLDPEILEECSIQQKTYTGLIHKLLEFMNKDEELQLQLEAIWILTYLISEGTSNQIRQIIEQGATPALIILLKSGETQLIEKAVKAVGNIASEASNRDRLLHYGILHPVIDVLNQALVSKNEEFIKQGTWALSNLCRGKPLPSYERVADATPVLCRVVQEVTDIEVLKDALWSLSYLSIKGGVARLLESDIVPPLIRYSDWSDIAMEVPALRTLGSILTGSDDQVDVLLKGPLARKYVKKLFKLLKQRTEQEAIRKVVCWSLSNITCQSSDYLDLVIGNVEYIEQLVNAALYDILDVQREAVWVLSNATVNANLKQMSLMGRNGVFNCLCKLIQQDICNPLDLLALTGILNLLNSETRMSQKQATNNKHLIKLKQEDVMKKIKESSGSQGQQVSEKAMKIWSRYLKGNLLRKNLRLKRNIICFRNERHSLFGISQNKKKKLCVSIYSFLS